MSNEAAFLKTVQAGYTFKGENAVFGVGMVDGKAVPATNIAFPLKTMNRHGLIAGATGTGKTKTLQTIAECLSDKSVPVLLMDIKGDLSGLAAAGTVNDRIQERYDLMGIAYQPTGFPVELMSLSNEKGVRLRATVSEFGPILLSKILNLNDTQQGIVALIFKYCDDHKLPLLDLKDFTKTIQYISNEGKSEIEKEYGKISTTSTGTILRKVIELQQQGADQFFGEISFDVDDLMRTDENGRGYINILRLTDMQNRPKLFSTFMLQLLDELYSTLPEEGDLDQPKLCIFIDEAHLVFQEASSALLEKIETIIKLIRSKGVGIFFCTQNPQDIPAGVLSQLGLKVQHALRAFTAADRKVIKKAAENYPVSEFYQTDELLTQLGTGEALVSLLNEKGIPTPLVHTLIASPRSRMDILSEQEIDRVVQKSRLVKKYDESIDSKSAYEILTAKLDAAAEQTAQEEAAKAGEKEKKATSGRTEKSTIEKVFEHSAVKQIMRTAGAMITRSLLGGLGLNRTTKSKAKRK